MPHSLLSLIVAPPLVVVVVALFAVPWLLSLLSTVAIFLSRPPSSARRLIFSHILHALYCSSYRLFSVHLPFLLAMEDALPRLVLALEFVPPPKWWGGAPQLGACLLLSFSGGRILSPVSFLGRLGRSLYCSCCPPSMVGLVAVVPAPSVVHRDSAPQPDLPPPCEVVCLVGVFCSTVAVSDCVTFFLLLVLTLQFAVFQHFLCYQQRPVCFADAWYFAVSGIQLVCSCF